MKKQIRSLSMIAVLLALLAAALYGAASLSNAAAETADNRCAPTAAFCLPADALGQEMTSGEWRYALRAGDGYAVITGYSGTSSHPIVPATLGGADVVGLADGAFSHAPKAVTLHGNVLLIAENAFSGARPPSTP